MPLTKYLYTQITVVHPEVDVFLLKVDSNHNTINAGIIPEPQAADIARYRNYIDRQKRLLTRSFLYEFLAERYGISNFELGVNQFKKPFLLAAPKINFSFSYSKEYAMVGILNNNRLGVDIEFIDEDLNIDELASEIMCDEELEYFYSCGYDLYAKRNFFFKLFSMKESIVKSFGTGLYFPVKSLNILAGDRFVFEGSSFACAVIAPPITGFSMSFCYEITGQI
jgi:4'-phosphopantetheinyl transferase